MTTKHFPNMAVFVNSSGKNGTNTTKAGVEIPLGFMVPDGNDKAAEKRKKTAQNWAKSWSSQKNDFLEISIENRPVSGFEIVDSVSRWSTSNKYMRVADPRGFVLELSIDNVVQLLHHCSIDKGIIQQDCVWCRDGANNILVPVNSDLYKEVVENTELAGKRVQASVGDLVKTKDNEEVIFLGKRTIVCEDYHTNDWKLAERFLYVDSNNENWIETRVSNPVSEVIESAKWSKDECNRVIEDRRISVNGAHHIIGVVNKPLKSGKVKLVPTDEELEFTPTPSRQYGYTKSKTVTMCLLDGNRIQNLCVREESQGYWTQRSTRLVACYSSLSNHGTDDDKSLIDALMQETPHPRLSAFQLEIFDKNGKKVPESLIISKRIR